MPNLVIGRPMDVLVKVDVLMQNKRVKSTEMCDDFEIEPKT